MPAFSWVSFHKMVVDNHTQRAKIQAKIAHPDFARLHPSEVREAQAKNYTVLTKRIVEEHKKHEDGVKARRLKVFARRR